MTAVLPEFPTALLHDPALDPRSPFARLAALLDDPRPTIVADGVVAARGLIDGVEVYAFATDPAVQGGALGRAGSIAIADTTDAALAAGAPVIGVWHSGGARLGEGVAALDGVARIFTSMTLASGRIPQVSVVLGAAAGGAAYGPALTDVVVMGPAGRVFVTGPDVVRSVTGEQVDAETLGGPLTHGRSGVSHVAADSEADALAQARTLVALLARPGDPGAELPPADAAMGAVLPESPRRAYDVHPLVARLLDEGAPSIELQPRWARNVVTTLGRLGGATVGVVANNPLRLGGCLDAPSAEKAARFVRLCDAFGIPLVVVVDVPGYLPGVRQEHEGVVRRGAKLLHAFAGCSVPRVTLVTRKAYGGAYIAMNARGLGSSAVLAWPTAQIGVMGSTAAVGILKRRELAAETDPAARAALQERLAAEYEADTGGLSAAVALGVVDRVIDPADSRREIVRALEAAVFAGDARRGSHGNIPL